MALMRCAVSFRDGESTTHDVEVDAETLYEAVAKPLRIFREAPWSQDAAWQIGYLKVEIQRRVTRQKVLLKRFDEWLTRPGGSPKDVIQRERIRDLLKG